jgi:hypothetical protein
MKYVLELLSSVLVLSLTSITHLIASLALLTLGELFLNELERSSKDFVLYKVNSTKLTARRGCFTLIITPRYEYGTAEKEAGACCSLQGGSIKRDKNSRTICMPAMPLVKTGKARCDKNPVASHGSLTISQLHLRYRDTLLMPGR